MAILAIDHFAGLGWGVAVVESFRNPYGLEVDEAKLADAMNKVDGVHQIHGEKCLCGFQSSRSRSRTEHITQAFAEHLRGGGQ